MSLFSYKDFFTSDEPGPAAPKQEPGLAAPKQEPGLAAPKQEPGLAALAFVYGIPVFYSITFVSAVIVLFCIFVLYIQFREILCTWAERREY